jgi:methionyl aminopeptidase
MIICKSPAEIEKLRRSGQVVRQVLLETKELVKPGESTLELERFVEKRLRELGAVPASKGYRGYPWCLCTSVNDEIVHGMPSNRRLREGDIIGLDLGVIVDGYYGDSALTVPVGQISPEAAKLIRVTEESLEMGIQQARYGNRLGDISFAVQQHVERNGFSVVREMVGHGIGREYHEEPQVPNFGRPGHGPVLKEGMVFTIEPMVNAGDYAMRILDDQWTAVTVDGSLSAHFEHTIAVTRNGPEVLSRQPAAPETAQTT